MRMCFNFKDIDKGLFYVSSFDGELVYADFVKPEGEDNPDYCKAVMQVSTSIDMHPVGEARG